MISRRRATCGCCCVPAAPTQSPCLLTGVDGYAQVMFLMAPVLFVLAIFPWLMEMASLLSTGQMIPFFIRLLHLLG
jgi:hypothetical protein